MVAVLLGVAVLWSGTVEASRDVQEVQRAQLEGGAATLVIVPSPEVHLEAVHVELRCGFFEWHAPRCQYAATLQASAQSSGAVEVWSRRAFYVTLDDATIATSTRVSEALAAEPSALKTEAPAFARFDVKGSTQPLAINGELEHFSRERRSGFALRHPLTSFAGLEVSSFFHLVVVSPPGASVVPITLTFSSSSSWEYEQERGAESGRAVFRARPRDAWAVGGFVAAGLGGRTAAFRAGFEASRDGWWMLSTTAEWDFRRETILTPSVQLLSASPFLIAPSLGAGLGIPVRAAPRVEAGVRAIGSVHFPLVGVELTVDAFPTAPPDERWRVGVMGRLSL